jgi:carbamoylphosphate synthase large subunit
MKRPNKKKPVVLVTAVGAPPGFNTLRFLHESGRYQLIAADMDPHTSGLYQYLHEGVSFVIPPKAEDTDVYINFLCDYIRKQKIDAIIPCIEEEALVMAEHQKLLETHGARTLLPEIEIIRTASNKALSTQIAEEHGISCPKSVLVKREYDDEHVKGVLTSFIEICPLPWIVKPTRGRGMRGVKTVEAFEEALSIVQSCGEDMLIQEYIPGKVGSVYMIGLLCDREGKVWRRFSSRSFRTHYKSGGPATAGISVSEPEVISNSEKILNAIGRWRGPAGVEWIRDPRDGDFRFMEINCRLWGYSSLAAGAGANFHVATAELALGEKVTPDPGFKEGVVMMRTSYDLIFESSPFDLEI